MQVLCAIDGLSDLLVPLYTGTDPFVVPDVDPPLMKPLQVRVDGTTVLVCITHENVCLVTFVSGKGAFQSVSSQFDPLSMLLTERGPNWPIPGFQHSRRRFIKWGQSKLLGFRGAIQAMPVDASQNSGDSLN
jgi:hypothetical protein